MICPGCLKDRLLQEVGMCHISLEALKVGGFSSWLAALKAARRVTMKKHTPISHCLLKHHLSVATFLMFLLVRGNKSSPKMAGDGAGLREEGPREIPLFCSVDVRSLCGNSPSWQELIPLWW